MSMTQADEFRHEPVRGAKWQENYLFHGWDADQNCGFYFHLGHVYDEGMIDIRAVVIVDGKATAMCKQVSGDDCLGAPGLDTVVVTPLERMKLHFRGEGKVGPSDDGWFGNEPGESPFGFDIEWISEHPIVDWAPHVAATGLDPNVSGNHYEQGARWKGRLWSAGKEIEAQGLLVRDHSWGSRGWKNLWPIWTPITFDGGRRFISGMATAHHGKWSSFSVLSDSSGIVNVSHDNWVQVIGPLVPRQYMGANFLRMGDGFQERYTYEGRFHLAFERHASFLDKNGQPIRRGITDMFSVVRGEGHVGFGTLNSVTTPTLVKQGYDDPA